MRAVRVVDDMGQALNMRDLVTDTMRNFNPQYENYVQPVRVWCC